MGLLMLSSMIMKNYYLPANKGGRGFLVMSKELLTKLNSTDSPGITPYLYKGNF